MAETSSFEDLLWRDEDMESIGYKIVSTGFSQKTEVTASVKKAIGSDQLSGLISGDHTSPSMHWEGGKSDALFNQFAEHGLDVS